MLWYARAPPTVEIENPPVPFVMFLKNERGEEFIARYYFWGITENGPLQIHTLMLSMSATTWGKKANWFGAATQLAVVPFRNQCIGRE